MRKEIEVKVKDLVASDNIALVQDAARLLEFIRGYAGVTLDFFGIEDATREFIQELFVGWPEENPAVSISVINVSQRIEERIIEALSNK